MFASDGDPFWVPALGEWVDAADLRQGQWLRTSAGALVQITAIKRWTQDTTVHNLTVADLHTYYVLAGQNSILVHNSGECPLWVVRHETASQVAGNYTQGQKIRDPASQWYHEMLSDEELLDTINDAAEGDGIAVSPDGKILGGHHHWDELKARIKDGRISPDTQIRVDVYNGE
ncbi:HINT domain-containing protein [Streptomyces sp. CNQ085]|nr:polymorphic toxin-type HINT domain-containing protein [Streptomyces sp. CNQ085]MCI0383992.1 HINT domain-containing protein [Streptomyces sp. CNQ085]